MRSLASKGRSPEKSGILPYHRAQVSRTVREVRGTERLGVPISYPLGNVEMSSDLAPALVNFPGLLTSVYERER